MKKQNLGLLIGGGLCGVGIFLFLYMGFVVATDYPNLVVLISGEQLSPGGAVGGVVEINHRDDFFIGVGSNPPVGPLVVNLVGEDGTEIISGAIDDVLFKRLSDVPNGFYQLQIQSLATETTQVYVVLSEKNLRDDFENIVNITFLGVLGFLLVFFGIILMIVIGIYVVIVKIKSNKISKNS